MTNIQPINPLTIPVPLTRDGKPRVRAYGARRTYTPEDKAQALRLIALGKTQAETARELGIKEVTVGAWFRADREARRATQPSPEPTAARDALLALRSSLKQRIAALDRDRNALAVALRGVVDALDL